MRAAPAARARAARRGRGSVRRRGRATSTSSAATTRPGRGDRTSTRSARTIASSTSWVTSTTVRGWARSVPASQSCISWRVSASRAANGSSRQRTVRPDSSVRANATRWRIPPDSSAGRARSKPPRPKSRSSAAACSRAAPRSTPATRSASAALSTALRHGSSRSRWAMSAAGAASTVPVSGAGSPQTSSSSVVLPQPLGPTTATISPGRAVRLRPRTAVTGGAPRRGAANVLATSCSTTDPSPVPLSAGASSGARVRVSMAPLRGNYPTGSKGLDLA